MPITAQSPGVPVTPNRRSPCGLTRSAWCRLIACDTPLWSCSGATTHTSRASSRGDLPPGSPGPARRFRRRWSARSGPAPARSAVIVRALFDASGPRRPACRHDGKETNACRSSTRRCISGAVARRAAHHRQTSHLYGRGTDQGDGRGRRERRGAASAKLGSWLQRNGGRGREEISGQVLHPWLVPARQTRGAQAHRDLEAATGHAGAALVADTTRAGELASGRHDGLAVAGGGTRRHAESPRWPGASCRCSARSPSGIRT